MEQKRNLKHKHAQVPLPCEIVPQGNKLESTFPMSHGSVQDYGMKIQSVTLPPRREEMGGSYAEARWGDGQQTTVFLAIA